MHELRYQTANLARRTRDLVSQHQGDDARKAEENGNEVDAVMRRADISFVGKSERRPNEEREDGQQEEGEEKMELLEAENAKEIPIQLPAKR
jgi:hypothetical protein